MPTTAPVSADRATVPAVGPREPCPCGSGRRYKACHGGRRAATAVALRPFEGLVDEPDWVALREVVPSATAPLSLRPGRGLPAGAEDRRVTLATLLPTALPALTREDGEVVVALQTASRSGDASRDLAQALLAALDTRPGEGVLGLSQPAADGPRLQDLLAPEPLDVTVHEGFDWWLGSEGSAALSGEAAEQMAQANANVVPTVRLPGVGAAYWCRIGDRAHLRWALPNPTGGPDPEEALLDAFARLAADGRLGLGPDTRYVGAFRTCGLLVPVWDLPLAAEASAWAQPAADLRARLDEVLADRRPLTAAERRARAGVVSRQLTLR